MKAWNFAFQIKENKEKNSNHKKSEYGRGLWNKITILKSWIPLQWIIENE